MKQDFMGWIGKLLGLINGKADTSHTHAASDIASGTVATARLGSGSADNTVFLRGDQTWAAPAGGGLSDGDKGDITVSSSGSAWAIDPAAVTLAKMANLAQDQFIGRVTASTGVPETATVTAAARTVLDDASVSAMVDTLGGASSTGTGGLVRATSPTLVTPALGTPASGVLTNCTGLPVPGGLVNTDGDLATAINSGACAAALPSTMWMMLIADYALANSAAEQKLFNTTTNGTLTLPAGVYYFEAFVYILGMSGTSGNLAFDLLGAGTATMDRWGWQATGADNASPLNGNTCGTSATVTQQSVASVISAAVGTGIQFTVRGMVRISSGGTIIPSGTLANASAATVKAGSWIKVQRLGTSSETYRGAWT